VAEGAVLWARLIGARIRSQLQYRTSFAVELAGMFLVGFLDFAAILIIFENVPQLAGWSVHEVALLYGIAGLAFALTDLAVGHLDYLPALIRDGNFDLILLRPRGTLYQVVTSDFHLRRLGKLAQATVVLVYALTALDIGWNAGRVVMLPVTILSAAAIFAAIWVTGICIVFWAVEARETVSAFTDAGNFLAQYPITVYEAWLRRLLAFVIPTAFVAYFPALYILDKPDPLGAAHWLRFAAPAVAALAWTVAVLTWRFAVRHYQSAGG
jgi:ABC-2 type transport system permease protein